MPNCKGAQSRPLFAISQQFYGIRQCKLNCCTPSLWLTKYLELIDLYNPIKFMSHWKAELLKMPRTINTKHFTNEYIFLQFVRWYFFGVLTNLWILIYFLQYHFCIPDMNLLFTDNCLMCQTYITRNLGKGYWRIFCRGKL